MNNYTEQQIEEQLKQIASIEPSENSARQMNQSVRRIIANSGKKPATRSFFYYAVISAAVLLIGMSVLYNSSPSVIPSMAGLYTQTKPQLTLAKLNTVFESGGHQALDDYFEMVEQNRQPRAETITLQQIMKEL